MDQQRVDKKEDVRVCIIGGGGVGQSAEVNNSRGIVDGVVEIPEEGDKEDRGIEGNLGDGDIEALRRVVDEEK